jgi:hypothetical protein
MTDFILPGMNGRELATGVVATHRDTRVLYMSVYAKESFSRRGLDFRECVSGKAVYAGILANRVREALGRPLCI